MVGSPDKSIRKIDPLRPNSFGRWFLLTSGSPENTMDWSEESWPEWIFDFVGNRGAENRRIPNCNSSGSKVHRAKFTTLSGPCKWLTVKSFRQLTKFPSPLLYLPMNFNFCHVIHLRFFKMIRRFKVNYKVIPCGMGEFQAVKLQHRHIEKCLENYIDSAIRNIHIFRTQLTGCEALSIGAQSQRFFALVTTQKSLDSSFALSISCISWWTPSMTRLIL